MNADRSFFCDTPLDASTAVRSGVCRSCGGGIAVPGSARFCPQCGATLRARGISNDEADAVDRFAAIREAEQALPPLPPFVLTERGEGLPPFARLASESIHPPADNVATASTPPPLPPLPGMSLRNFHSDVLVAYATALFRLGWRYERGRGAPRNVAEAIRCYCKSARLGNRSAAARLDESSHFPS